PGDWQVRNVQCLANMRDMVQRYGSEVMVCEVGMSWDEAPTAKLFLEDLISKTRTLADGKGLGGFYWEPRCYGGWEGYTWGAFDAVGKPTVARDAFGG